MPFRSEKQRRYLWATKPEMAKRWAHEYPQKKKLPMYADSKKKEPEVQKEKAAQINLTQPDNFEFLLWEISAKYKIKLANSMLKQIEMPQRPEPTYAGQEIEEGRSFTSKTSPKNNQHMAENNQNMLNTEQNNNDEISHPLLKKLSGVLSQRIRQMLAGQEAYAPENVNLMLHKQQPPSAPIPPPMGMAAAPGQAPQAAQAPAPQPAASPSVMDPAATPAPPKMANYAPQLAQNFPDLPKGVSRTAHLNFQQKQELAKAQEQKNRYKPVGNSNSPNANPINSYGAIGNGSIGNSAFGTRNNIVKTSTCSQIIKRVLRCKTATNSKRVDLNRVLTSALVSAGGGLALGSYPGLKLQNWSQAAGHPELVTFAAGKAPIAIGSAVSGGLYNYLRDQQDAAREREKTAPPKARDDKKARGYLKYLLH